MDELAKGTDGTSAASPEGDTPLVRFLSARTGPGWEGLKRSDDPTSPFAAFETREEAVSQIREAIRLYIAVLEEDHLPVPEERFDTLLVAV